MSRGYNPYLGTSETTTLVAARLLRGCAGEGDVKARDPPLLGNLVHAFDFLYKL